MHVFKQGLDGEMYKITFKGFVIHEDLEMTLHTEIERWNFVDGQPVSSYIDYINSLEGDDFAKGRIIANNRPFQAPANTRGNIVDPLTGEKAEIGISELQFWQAIPLAAFPGATTLSECVYASLNTALNNMKI